ncbi:hypothetical protein [Sphingobacterium sp. LRF_L2]|uniref:hypothetical protein n=1 Tax=Sphingobacterium sp. LRF_L2 TaxID=3369421 RepID=UPI003F5FFC49
MNDKQIDKLFSDYLKDKEVSPDQDLWKKISDELDREKVIPLWRRRWISYAAACVLIGTISWGTFHYFNTDFRTDEMPRLAQQPKVLENAVKQPLSVPLTLAEETPKMPEETRESLPSSSSGESPALKNENSSPNEIEKKKLMRLEIEVAQLQQPTYNRTADVPQHITYRVVEIDPIQPLIENLEEEDTMLAVARPTQNNGLVSGLLNKISDVINPDETKTVHFSNDDEGSLRIDVYNTFVRNRTKKRK